MLLDPKHLATIEIIHQEGSLVGAARRLTTSQPALSRLLNDLEVRLDGAIFDRSLRPWQLTALGRVLSEQGRAILRAQDRASMALDEFHGGEAGTLKVGGTPFFVDGVLSSLMAKFQLSVPEMRFEIQYGYADALLDALRKREIDMAVCPFDMIREVPGIKYEPLTWGQNAIACRVDHPLTRLTLPRPLALLDYPWVVPPAGSPLADDMRLVLAGLGMSEVRIALMGGSLASVLNYLQNSDALCVLPQLTVEHAAKEHKISKVGVETVTPRRRLNVATNSDDVEPRIQRQFIEFLTSNIM